MLWDVRSAKGCLRTFDQHNGDTSAGPKSGISYIITGPPTHSVGGLD